jgi:hypothetical protein
MRTESMKCATCGATWHRRRPPGRILACPRCDPALESPQYSTGPPCVRCGRLTTKSGYCAYCGTAEARRMRVCRTCAHWRQHFKGYEGLHVCGFGERQGDSVGPDETCPAWSQESQEGAGRE